MPRRESRRRPHVALPQYPGLDGNPPDRADGTPSLAASPDRYGAINAMLDAEAKRRPGSVQVLDIDKTVSPDHRYDAKVKGQLCRFDGIHFSVFCVKLLEPTVVGEVRRQPAHH